MSNVSTRYFSNAIVGTPSVGADVNILEVNELPKFAIGTGFTRQDGARFRYGYASAGVAAGTGVSPTFASAGVTLISNAVIAPASATSVAGDTIKPGSVGSRYIQFTKASVTEANIYKGGYVIISDGSGQGFTYRIKGNTITGDPVSGDLRLELYEALKYALIATTDIIIVPNLWNDVIVSDGTNAAVAGVAMGTTTSSLQYGWFCVHGQVGCKQDGAWTAGAPLVRGADGFIMMGAGLTNTVQIGSTGGQIVGYAVADGGDNKIGVAFINLE